MQQSGRFFYLSCMDNRYQTLQTLAAIVQDTPQPTQYQCTPREMILYSTLGWDLIYKHLLMLEGEGMVLIEQADTLQFSITQEGLDKVSSLAPPVEELLRLTVKQETLDK